MAAVLCWRAPGAGCTASPKVWLGQTRNFGVSLWYTCATALILLTRKTTARFQVAFHTGPRQRRIPRAAGACCPMHEPCLCVRTNGESILFPQHLIEYLVHFTGVHRGPWPPRCPSQVSLLVQRYTNTPHQPFVSPFACRYPKFLPQLP